MCFLFVACQFLYGKKERILILSPNSASGKKKNFYKGTFFLIGSSLLGLVLKHWYLLPFLVKREKYNKQ
jgi:hypothetical protein